MFKTILRLTALLGLAATCFISGAPVAASTACLSSNGSWADQFLPATETGSFRVEYDATPSATTMDAVSGISYGFANEYTDLAAAVRFNLSGTIDARSGSGFAAANYIPYSKNVTYHFIFDVNITAHSYNIYVVVGSTQKTVGSNFKFRSEQSADTYLNSVGTLSATGSLNICNVALSTSSSSSGSSLVLNASSTSLNFGNVSTSAGASNQNITLRNAGTSNVTISKSQCPEQVSRPAAVQPELRWARIKRRQCWPPSIRRRPGSTAGQSRSAATRQIRRPALHCQAPA